MSSEPNRVWLCSDAVANWWEINEPHSEYESLVVHGPYVPEWRLKRATESWEQTIQDLIGERDPEYGRNALVSIDPLTERQRDELIRLRRENAELRREKIKAVILQTPTE